MDRASLIAALRAFAGPALVERGETCFLVDPGWGERERAQWSALSAQSPSSDTEDGRGWLCVPTGGSSGALKLARHDEHTLGAAALAFAQHFSAPRVNALGLLPPWHVSGLLAWARCQWTGGVYTAGEWRGLLAAAERPRADGGFVSLVPTQLARLAASPGGLEWLKGFDAVLLGGGPCPQDLLARARAARVPLAPGYGSTETAALICALRPAEFLAGAGGCGSALPHARLALDGEGRIGIEATSLFYGYWPQRRAPGAWRSDDLGCFDAAGHLHVLGRADALVISGGEKINPAEVEAELRACGGLAAAELVVLGVPHPEWGEELVALMPEPEDGAPVPAWPALREALRGRLAPAKIPRRLLLVPAACWPWRGPGKVDRAALRHYATHA
jgi:o-succinylbenzoate---CoA ligase